MNQNESDLTDRTQWVSRTESALKHSTCCSWSISGQYSCTLLSPLLWIVSGFRKKDTPFVLFCSFIFLDRSDKKLTGLRTCLWNPGTYRHKTQCTVWPPNAQSASWVHSLVIIYKFFSEILFSFFFHFDQMQLVPKLLDKPTQRKLLILQNSHKIWKVF